MSPFCCYALLSVRGQRLLSPPQDKKRRSELCSLISCCNEADASVYGSQVPAASSLRRAEVTGPAAANTFPRPVCSSTNNRGATECSPNWKVLQVCECWSPCWSVGTPGFGSRLPAEPSKLATSVLLAGRRHSSVGTGHSGWRGAHADTNCLGDGGGTPGRLPTSVACHRVHERQVLIRCFWLWSLGRPSSVSPSVKWVDQQCPSVGWWGLTEAIFAKNPGTRKGALCLYLPNKTKGSLRWRRDQTQTQRVSQPELGYLSHSPGPCPGPGWGRARVPFPSSLSVMRPKFRVWITDVRGIWSTEWCRSSGSVLQGSWCGHRRTHTCGPSLGSPLHLGHAA
uniref:uncharacterized protein LOC132668537 n=1 Tax=Panthera onca TaxID=9690 RepID=UPI002952FE5B|nr:uncharacterized protein LOC132668537 [Panthera onca]XP_060473434.1 uncharacterized protein LOC132668537 [Panthera onca]